MTKLYGMTGSHGTGKSSTIDFISDRSPTGIRVSNEKLSRHVLNKMGLTLEQATATPELAMNYQERVLHAAFIQYQSICFGNTEGKSIIVDRTVVDIYAYTRLWAEKNGIEAEWLAEFKSDCIRDLGWYDKIFFFPTGVFPFVDDGVRAKEDTQLVIAQYMEEFLKENFPSYHVIKSSAVDDRANEIIKIITDLK
jgi:nicotinamide riboside kinase